MSPDAADISVTSEIGRLRAVVCHRPGPELAVVTPENQPGLFHVRRQAIEFFIDVDLLREEGDLLFQPARFKRLIQVIDAG